MRAMGCLKEWHPELCNAGVTTAADAAVAAPALLPACGLARPCVVAELIACGAVSVLPQTCMAPA